MAKIAPVIAAEIVRLRTVERLTLREIAAREFTVSTRVSVPAISRILKAAGLPAGERVRHHASRIEIDEKRARALRDGGMGYFEIAARFGVSRTKIYNALNAGSAPVPKSAALRRGGAW